MMTRIKLLCAGLAAAVLFTGCKAVNDGVSDIGSGVSDLGSNLSSGMSDVESGIGSGVSDAASDADSGIHRDESDLSSDVYKRQNQSVPAYTAERSGSPVPAVRWKFQGNKDACRCGSRWHVPRRSSAGSVRAGS